MPLLAATHTGDFENFDVIRGSGPATAASMPAQATRPITGWRTAIVESRDHGRHHA